jgi:hypothetical protein
MDRMTSHPMISRHLASARSAAAAALAGVLLSACGGGGGGGGGGPPPASVTISGQITFDRIPFDAVIANGLNPAGTVQAPARQVTVQAIAAAGGSVLATATTDTSGNYSLSVPSNTNLFIRARAEMIKTGAAPTWNFSVRNNTSAGANDALYVLDGATFSSGATNRMHNLNAPSGFVGNSYANERAAASFAILDSVFRAKELVLTASPNAAFPELRLFWSEENRANVQGFCPDDGDIGTSSYVLRGPPPLDVDDCGQPFADGIYILGDFAGGAGDTDEFDQSVIAHEFGHYLEDRFGRSDSLGGEHGNDVPLDPRVAFGEGFGNAFSGMALGDPVYRDSQQGVQAAFGIDMETDDAGAGVTEGWFSELSVGEILWDLFDPANEAGDTAALGFAPLFGVMTGAQIDTEALTSIFTFAEGLRDAQPASLQAIDDLLEGEGIFGTDDFGAGESNAAGDAAVLPLYKTVTLNAPPMTVCSRSPVGDVSTNKLGNRVFLRFDNNAARLVTIQVDGATNGSGTTFATDPDVFVLRQGALVQAGLSSPPGPRPHSTAGSETVAQFLLAAGTVIIEVYDFEMNLVVNPQPRCMTVAVQGT